MRNIWSQKLIRKAQTSKMRPFLQLLIIYFPYRHCLTGEVGWPCGWGVGVLRSPSWELGPGKQRWLTTPVACPLETPSKSVTMTRVLKPTHSCSPRIILAIDFGLGTPNPLLNFLESGSSGRLLSPLLPPQTLGWRLSCLPASSPC